MSIRTTPGARTLSMRTCVAGVATLAAIALPMASASAEPGPDFPSRDQVTSAKAAVTTTQGKVADLDARYQSASAQLENVQEAAAAAGEAYNGAKLLLAQRTSAAQAAAQTARTAQAQADQAQKAIRQFASLAYQQNGSLGDVAAYLSGGGPEDLVDRATAMDTIGQVRAQAYALADSASELATTARLNAQRATQQQQQAADAAAKAYAAAKAQADAAAAEAARIQQSQQAMAAELASLQKTSVQLEQARQDGLRAEAIARAAAEEAARQARVAAATAARERTRAAAAAAARAKAAAAQAARQAEAARAAAQKAAREAAQHNHGTTTPRPSNPAPKPPHTTNPPAPRGGVAAVIGYAQAQIGKWYLWGGSGPDQFDCSGLTMMAWRQAGVYLDHYTGSQYDQTRRVAISDLQPGDLVFYGVSGPASHHVGLYVGNGQMIEAPHTGAQVRYASIYRSDLLPYGGRP